MLLNGGDGAVHAVGEETAFGCARRGIAVPDGENFAGGANDGKGLLIHVEPSSQHHTDSDQRVPIDLFFRSVAARYGSAQSR